MTALSPDETTALLDGAPAAVVIDVSWDSGLIECEAVLFVMGADGRVLSDAYFIFYNQPRSPGREVFHRRFPADRPQRAQFLVHVEALPESAAALDIVIVAQARDLERVVDVRLVVWDPGTGEDLATYAAGPTGPVRSSLLGQLYRHLGTWKLRAIDKHYDRDLAAVAQERGVNV